MPSEFTQLLGLLNFLVVLKLALRLRSAPPGEDARTKK